MAKEKTTTDLCNSIFTKLHIYQVHGADNLTMLLTKYTRGRIRNATEYIEVVAKKAGVSKTGRITTTNKDIMVHIVRAMVEVSNGVTPLEKEINEAWELFITAYRQNKIKL